MFDFGVRNQILCAYNAEAVVNLLYQYRCDGLLDTLANRYNVYYQNYGFVNQYGQPMNLLAVKQTLANMI